MIDNLDEVVLPRVSGAEVLDEVHAAITRYVVLPSPEAADAVTLWVAATHAVGAWQHAPRLLIRSPVKRCGKSRLLDIIEHLCHDPLLTTNASTAAIVRSVVGESPCTLLVDEADALFGTRKAAEAHEDLRSVLNAGFQRGRRVHRYDVQSQRVVAFDTFAMVALAGIGRLPDTISDRSVVVSLARRRTDEPVAPFRSRRDAAVLTRLRQGVQDWLIPHLSSLEDAEPVMPLEDRAADTWEPLVAVADLAGGRWPHRARAASLALTREQAAEDLDASDGQRMLADVRAIFERAAEPTMSSAQLVRLLVDLEDAPWQERHLNQRGLARLLQPFGIRPTKVRTSEGPLQGYRRDKLAEVWARYLSGDPVDTERPEPCRSEDGSSVPEDPAVPEPRPDGEHRVRLLTSDVPDVPAQERNGVRADRGWAG